MLALQGPFAQELAGLLRLKPVFLHPRNRPFDHHLRKTVRFRVRTAGTATATATPIRKHLCFLGPSALLSRCWWILSQLFRIGKFSFEPGVIFSGVNIDWRLQI